MKHLLNLLAAVALLVWGTHLVRTGVLRVFGGNLRKFLARSMRNRFTAALSGIGVTALVQSSTATSLMTSSFVGQGLITLPAARAVMRGYVVDFLDFHLAERHFPAFNVADSAITLGAICLILDELLRVRRGR